MKNLTFFFLMLGICTQFAVSQTFSDGSKIALKTDLNLWIRVCYDCQDMKYSSIDHTLVPYQSASNAPDVWEIFTVENQDGKVRLKTEGGKYLSNCSGCRKDGVDGSGTIAATMKLENGRIRPEGLFDFVKLDNGKYTIKTSAGTYLTRYQPRNGMKGGKRHIITAYMKTFERDAAQFEINVISSGPISLPYVSTTERDNGVVKFFNYETYLEDIKLEKIEGDQSPTAFLSIETQVGVYENQRYVNINAANSRVSASYNGEMLYDELGERGWYLEYVDVLIEALDDKFKLASYGPHTQQQEGTVTSTSGVNLSSGADISTSNIGANANIGMNFQMSYSSNLKSFSIQDNSSANTIVTRTKLTSTIGAETWSLPKGGDQPYQNSKDLLRMDAAGQLGDVPLNYLPDLAKSNLTLASMGTFKAPNDFHGVAQFKIKIIMHIVKVKRTLGFLSVTPSTEAKNYTIERVFSVDFNH